MTSSLMRTAGVALALGALSTGAASAEIFLKIPSVPGDSLQRGFEDQIPLMGAGLSVMSFQMPDPEGLAETVRTPSMGPIMLTKRPDRASPKLMQAALTGQPLGPIEISFTGSARPAVEPPVEERWIIEGAQVTNYSIYPSTEPGVAPIENIEITYARLRYQHFVRDAKGGRGAGMEEVVLDVPKTPDYGFEQGCG